MSLARCARTVTRNMTAPRPSPVLSLLAQLPRHRSFATYPSAREEQAAAPPQPTRTPIGQIQRRLQITFTCTAEIPIEGAHAESPQSQPCHHRSTHEFSRTSYEKGIVLVECPGCKNRHLIGEQIEAYQSSRNQTHSPAHFHSGQPVLVFTNAITRLS